MWAKFEPILTRLQEQINDSPLIIELRSRYSELDAKTQQIIAIATISVVTLFILLLPISLAISVSGKKGDIAQDQKLIYFLKKARAEIDFLERQSRLAGQSPMNRVDPNAPIAEIAATSAAQASIGENSIEIKEGDGSNGALSVNVNKVSIRQVMGLLFSLENSGAPIVVSKLNIDLRDDRKGYMWADLSLERGSAPTNDSEKKKKSFTR